MEEAVDMQQFIILLVACFVGYRVIQKVRSDFSWRELRTGKLVFRIVLFAAVGVLFMTQSGFGAISIVSDIAGILAGAALGVVGNKLTSFERRGAGLYFKANAWIGGIVTTLFIGRLAFRVYEMIEMSLQGEGWNFQFNVGGGQWASGLLFIMFAYYVVYYSMLMKHSKQVAAHSDS